MARRGSRLDNSRFVSRSRVHNDYGFLDPLSFVSPRSILSDPILDRRSFHPAGPIHRPVTNVRGASRLVVKPTVTHNSLSARVGFEVPDKVAVCVRRKQRKEVIHAIGRSGGGGSRKRRRTIWSDVDC